MPLNGDGSPATGSPTMLSGDTPRNDTQRSERPARSGERGGRGRGGAERTEGGERPPRQDRNQDRGDAPTEARGERGTEVREPREPREQREPREPREGRGEGRGERRPDRRPRQDQGEPAVPAGAEGAPTVMVDQTATEDGTATPTQGVASERTDSGEARESRPRERQGRERRPRSHRPRRDGESDRSPQGPDGEPQQALEGFAAPAAAPAEEPAAAVAPVAATAPVVASAPAATQSAPVATTGLPKVQAFALPVQDLAQIAESCGLQWINSDAEKIRVAQEAIAAQPRAVHVPRERPAPVVIDEGPLVLVETRRDLRNLTLPFEQTPA